MTDSNPTQTKSQVLEAASLDAVGIQFHTFGCKVNTYDTGLLQEKFEKGDFDFLNGRKLHILNTCAVTAEATKEAVRTVRRIKKRQPKSFVVVTGCGAQVDTDIFADTEDCDLVVGNSHKGNIIDLIEASVHSQEASKVHRSNIFRKSDVEAGGGRENHHTRGFLKVQDGCNSFCTYCVIPYARGRSRSVGVAELVIQVQQLLKEGVCEIVLTGIHLGDYWDEEKGLGLVTLIDTILKETQIPRIRLGSLEPRELSDDLLELYSNKRMCPHFHMSIQSASRRILKDMARHYDDRDVSQALLTISKKLPNAFVGMDVIVGFPGETEEEFMETYAALESLPWTRIHVFPYSSRPGTKASSMTNLVGASELRRRSELLRALSSERYTTMATKQLGKQVPALVWGDEINGYKGLTRDYWTVALDGTGVILQAGQEVMVELVSFDHSQKSRLDGIHRARLLD